MHIKKSSYLWKSLKMGVFGTMTKFLGSKITSRSYMFVVLGQKLQMLNQSLVEVASHMKYSWAAKKSGTSRRYSASSELSSTPLCKLEQCWQTPQRYPSMRTLPAGFCLPQRLIDFSCLPQKTHSIVSCFSCAGLFRMITGTLGSFPAFMLWQSLSPPLWRTHVWHMLPWHLIPCFWSCTIASPDLRLLFISQEWRISVHPVIVSV